MFATASQVLAGCADGHIFCIDVPSQQVLYEWHAHAGSVHSLQWFLADARSRHAADVPTTSNLTRQQEQEQQQLEQLQEEQHQQAVQLVSAAVQQCTLLALSSSEDGQLQLWSTPAAGSTAGGSSTAAIPRSLVYAWLPKPPAQQGRAQRRWVAARVLPGTVQQGEGVWVAASGHNGVVLLLHLVPGKQL